MVWLCSEIVSKNNVELEGCFPALLCNNLEYATKWINGLLYTQGFNTSLNIDSAKYL